MEEKELKEYLEQMVLEYASQMNELELKYIEIDGRNPDMDIISAYRKEYFPIFEKYCTDKERICGGKGSGFGSPPRYDSIENPVESNVEVKTESSAEVYFKTNNRFKAEYLFVVLKESGEWKIDAAKYKRYEKEKWDTLCL